MKNLEIEIKFSPIEHFFTEAELTEMIRIINPKECECYRNNWLFALLAKCKYPSIGCCEGIYDGLSVHFFNNIIVNGKEHFIDFSGYYLQKKHGLLLSGYALLLRQFTISEMKEFIEKKGFMCCTIDFDGTYEKYLNKMCSKDEIVEVRACNRKATLSIMSRESEMVRPSIA
jgi:hypothetical protein